MLKRLLATTALAFAVSAPATAAIINYLPPAGAPADIPGLTGFATSGSMMDGLAVTACFTSFCETRAWTDGGGPNAGGVSGTGWGLTLDGDTFSDDWMFNIGANTGQLLTLLLDGRTGLTIFDRTQPSTGTAGSAQGRDWTTALNGGTSIDVTYLNPTGVGGAAPVGDLFQQVFVSFLDLSGPRTSFTFQQDTDNDSRFFQVPEPSSLLLLGLGVLAMSLVRRRQH